MNANQRALAMVQGGEQEPQLLPSELSQPTQTKTIEKVMPLEMYDQYMGAQTPLPPIDPSIASQGVVPPNANQPFDPMMIEQMRQRQAMGQ